MPSPAPEKARSMAFLYVNGPEHLRGDWDACSKVAGYVRPPREGTGQIQTFIEEFRSQGSLVEDLLAGAEDLSWEELAEKARPVMAKIATGKAFASAQQIAALKEIIARGEGRVANKAPDIAEVGVVVLPKLGAGSEAHLCPRCLEQLQREVIDAAHRMGAEPRTAD